MMPSHRHKIEHKEKAPQVLQHLGARPVLKRKSRNRWTQF
jgi:hypothetical protein